MSLDLYLNVKVDVGQPEPMEFNLWWRNITHNVVPMWKKAGVYDALYNSDGMSAKDVVPILEKGIIDMAKHTRKYEALNPSNGWGNYEGAFEFLKEFLNKCKEYPKAVITVSK